jgi:hypothetical protein
VSPDLLDGLVIEMARVAHQRADVVCVLEALEVIGRQRGLGPLAQLHAVALALGVDALDPAVVALGIGVLDVLLEDDHVRVRHLLGLCRRENGRSIFVDGANLEDGRGSCQREQGECGVSHDCGGLALRSWTKRGYIEWMDEGRKRW